MSTLFFDTSALVRRYDDTEPGAGRVQAMCARATGNTLLIARITTVEVASALSRKVRERSLTPEVRDLQWELFQMHRRDEYRLVALDAAAFQEAERLAFRYPLRAYDAVQLATALRTVLLVAAGQADFRFCTADQRQAQAAGGEGLQVELIA